MESNKVLIGDDELNEEITNKLKNEEKYKIFLKWAFSNGLKLRNIDFPGAFGPHGVVGIVATDDIPPLTAVAMVPNKMLITPSKVMKSECGEIFRKYPRIFKNNVHNDFIQLATFLLQEKLKGEKSFYFPYINVISPECSSLSRWKEEEQVDLENRLFKEADMARIELDKIWTTMKRLFDSHPENFPPDKYTKQDFFWAFECVRTRSFGWQLPATMLIPFADFLNHSENGITHFVVNRRFERDEKFVEGQYFLKKRKADLALFGEEILTVSEEEKKVLFNHKCNRKKYIAKYFNEDFFSKEMTEKIKTQTYRRQEERDIVLQMNTRLFFDKKDVMDVWDLRFFDTSDDEDNDTDEEAEDGEGEYMFRKMQEEEIKDGRRFTKGLFDTPSTTKTSIDRIESEYIQAKGFRKKFDNDEKNKINQVSGEEDEYEEDEEEDNDQDEEEDEEEENEDEEKEQEDEDENEKRGSKSGREKNNDAEKILNDEKRRLEREKEFEQLKSLLFDSNESSAQYKPCWGKYEQIELDKIDETKKKLETKQTNQKDEKFGVKAPDRYKNEEEESAGEEEDQWDWFNDDDEDNFFVVSTDSETNYKKGEQVFNFYGKRSNRYLLLWYGFAVLNNRYNSLSFRLWINRTLCSEKHFDPKKIIFQDSVTNLEWVCGTVKHHNMQIKPRELTREFRVKESKLCEVVSMSRRIFEEILNSYATTIQEDEELLKQDIPARRQFAVVWKYTNKKIALEQLKLLDLVLAILNNLKKGLTLKEAYMQRYTESEKDDKEFLCNRKKISNYLRLLSIYLNK